jgi:hypothetical protein
MNNINKEKMIRYVYLTTNIVDSKNYVGLRNRDPKEDDYLGSGCYLKLAIKKYGKENFRKEILVSGLFTLDEICEYERYYISNFKLGNKAEYNIAKGGEGGGKRKGWHHTEESKRLIGMKVKEAQTPEIIEKMRNAKLGKLGNNFGKGGWQHTEEFKKKQSENNKGENNFFYGKQYKAWEGKHLTEEMKKAISDFGKKSKWWTNGKIQTKSISCPEGFYAGRLQGHNGGRKKKDIE